MPAPDSRHEGQVWLGGGLLVLLHLLALAIAYFVWGFNFTDSVLLIGLWQWLYVLPVVVIAALLKRYGLVQGLLIGAALTFLLNLLICGGMFFVFLA
jgi:hypothetical protein